VKKLIITASLALVVLIALAINGIIEDNRGPLYYNRDKYNVTRHADLDFAASTDYYDYLTKNTAHFPQDARIVIPGHDYTEASDTAEVLGTFEGLDDVLFTDETGSVTWTFDVDEAGFYNMRLNYFPIEGKSSMIERILHINGEVPFDGARNLTFQRIWGNANDVVQDIHGNDIRPSQIETPFWTQGFFRDSIGYVNEPYQFYLEKGENTITLEATREPVVIDSIEILSVSDLPSYEDVHATYMANGYSETGSELMLRQAQIAAYTTSPTLYPLVDSTSSATTPSSPTKDLLNTIGGNNWRIANDRIAWDFEVEESGLYAISMRVKQKLATGMNVSRNIYIDGEIPFEELKDYQFPHSPDWRIQTLGTQDEAFLFYFEAGRTYELSMEVSLGSYGALIAELQASIDRLNALYREILIYTGPEPDPFRDYQLEDRVTDLVARLQTEREILQEIRDQIIEISGTKSEKTGILDTILIQLRDFTRSPREIHRNLNVYNQNIASLGTLIILLSQQPLEIDYFAFHNPESDLPRNRDNFFARTLFAVRSFIATYTTDYDTIGRTTEPTDEDVSIEVWLSIGRDQANVLRKLIDETFTPETGIHIDLKLVSGPVLLPATLAGEGPEVAMMVQNDIPVNYAMRNAVYDLSQFDDFEEIVSSRFKESAIVPFNHEDGYYALPEQQIFLMMFYRKDIFEELGMTPPETWDDMITMIPDLQKHNLEFFLPIPIQQQGQVISLPPNPVYSSMFYQNDGEFYIDNNRESGFNEGVAPQIFETWTQFYTDYSFPVEANFVNRFRSGQMPIGIDYYNMYNVLSVFAPEIRGRWDFMPIPGTLSTDENGNQVIRRDTVSTGTSAMILENAENKDAAWEYLKWWTSTETQVRFGREMEGILGAAARYPTANVEAMQQLPWTVAEYMKLEEQWNQVRGIPEVPGGYMTGRHLDNALRMVLEDSTNPRETIYDFVQVINEELAKKRREFGLE